jgi:proteasome lid subunit RPN8/RPN11
MDVLLPALAESGIRRHGEADYPEECCGFLIGRAETSAAAVREILRIVPASNTVEVERRRRFVIRPEELRALESELEPRGELVIGFYHSHPDHPARPSQFDEEHAWPWYTYLVLGVQEGRAGALGAFELDESSRAFREVQLDRTDGAGWPAGKQDGKTSTASFPS